MKSVIDGGAAAPESTSPELLAHDWDAITGCCQNPEKLTIDFGKKAGKRSCTFELGLTSDGTWRIGWAIDTKESTHNEPCVLSGLESPNRAAALRNGLARAQALFAGDKPAVQTLAAYFSKTLSIAIQPPESSPANKPTADSRPLPPSRSAELPLKLIERNPAQARKDFPVDLEKELADSIASVGLLQPIVVRKMLPDELGEFPEFAGQDRYEIIAGERRYRAHIRLGRESIDCKVIEGLTRAQAKAASLVENLQREDLNPIEEAEGYRDLMATEGLTQEQCAQRVGKSRSVVANALRVLELPDDALAFVRQGLLTAAHGTALARFKAYPQVATAIAKIAVAKKTPAGDLETGLPFGEELERAGLALDLFAEIQEFNSVDHSTYDKIEKAHKKTAGFFFFEGGEYDESQCFVIDLDAGKKIVEEYQAADAALEKKREARKVRRVSGSDDDGEGSAGAGSPGGGMSPAEKRERQKKLDENLANRLQTSAVKHAAIERLKTVEGLDGPSLLVVCCEALKYDGQEIDEVAEQIGIKLPKDFEEPDGYGFDHGGSLTALAKLKPSDVVRLLAAALVMRDHDGAMLFASDVPSYAEFAARYDVRDPIDAASYVAEWKEKITPLVTSGRTSEEIAKELGCPDYIAEQLRKQIRREQRQAAEPSGKPKPVAEKAAAKPAPKKPAVVKAKKKGGRAVITDDTRVQVKRAVEQGKTGGEIAKSLGISLPSVQNIKKALGLVLRR